MKLDAASFVLGALLGTGAGAAVWISFDHDGGTRGAIAPAWIPEDEGPLHASPDPRGPTSLSIDPREAVLGAQSPARVEVDPEYVRELVAAQPRSVPPVEGGSGVIWGNVTRSDGSPMGGVVVRASSMSRRTWTSPDTVGEAAPPLPSIEETVGDAVAEFRRARARQFEVESDATGRFRFERLPEGRWQLRAYAPGFVFEAPAGWARDLPLGSRVDFVGSAVQRLAVDVLLPDGTRPAEAVVSTRLGEERAAAYAWTPDLAELRLTEGRYQVHAAAGKLGALGEDDFALQSEPVEVEVRAQLDLAPIVLQLAARNGITGLLTFEEGGPRGESPQIVLLALKGSAEPDLSRLAESKTTARPLGGAFAFLGLEPGRYAVGVTSGWGTPVRAHRVVEVTSGIVDASIEVPAMDLSGYLVARVLGPLGRELDGVEFLLRETNGSGTTSWGVNAMRHDDGRYLVPIQPGLARTYFSRTPSKSEFSVTVSHADYGARTVVLGQGQTELELAFGEPARLTLHLAGYAGSRFVDRVKATLVSEEGSGRPSKSSWIEPDGSLAFEPIEPGSYVIRLSLNEDTSRRMYRGHDLLDRAVELGVGPQTIDLALPPLYEVVVRHPRAQEGRRLSIFRREGNGKWMGSATFDSGGEALLDGLTAGSYTLSCYEPNEQMQIEVPCGPVLFEGDS